MSRKIVRRKGQEILVRLLALAIVLEGVFVSAPAVPTAQAAIANGMPAIDVMGQFDANRTDRIVPSFTKGTVHNGANRLGFGNATFYGAAMDTERHWLFVPEITNNRILVYVLETNNTLLDHVPDFVIGQTDFNGVGSGITAGRFNIPSSIAYDSARKLLFVSEQANNRVSIFDLTNGITNGMASSQVLGQPTPGSNSGLVPAQGCPTAPSPCNFVGPHGLAYDSVNQRLYVAATSYHRVQVFDIATITDGEQAVNVLGQPDFTTTTSNTTNGGCSTSPNACGFSTPQDVDIDTSGNRLFVTDQANNRVLVFDVTSITNGEAAAKVFGHPDFITATANQTNGGCSTAINACGMSSPASAPCSACSTTNPTSASTSASTATPA